LLPTMFDANRRSFRGQVLKPPVQGHSSSSASTETSSISPSGNWRLSWTNTGLRPRRAIVDGDGYRQDTGPGKPAGVQTATPTTPPKQTSGGIGPFPDMFEPGSTFKVVVADLRPSKKHLTTSDELIDCQMGSIRIGGHTFHDVHPYGLLTFIQVLEKSSNIGRRQSWGCAWARRGCTAHSSSSDSGAKSGSRPAGRDRRAGSRS